MWKRLGGFALASLPQAAASLRLGLSQRGWSDLRDGILSVVGTGVIDNILGLAMLRLILGVHDGQDIENANIWAGLLGGYTVYDKWVSMRLLNSDDIIDLSQQLYDHFGFHEVLPGAFIPVAMNSLRADKVRVCV